MMGKFGEIGENENLKYVENCQDWVDGHYIVLQCGRKYVHICVLTNCKSNNLLIYKEINKALRPGQLSWIGKQTIFFRFCVD